MFPKWSTVQGLKSMFRSHCHKFFLLMFIVSSLSLPPPPNVKGKAIQNTCYDKLFRVKRELPTILNLKNHSPQLSVCKLWSVSRGNSEGWPPCQHVGHPCSALNSPSRSILYLPVRSSSISLALLGSLCLTLQNGRCFIPSSLPDAE